MVDTENSELTAAEDSNLLKQAACHFCRRSKVKCVRPADATACKKCASAGVECVVPKYHVGRYKGVKNKRSGLDKAIHQVEEAVKKARTKGSAMQDEHTRALRQLLTESEDSHVMSAGPNRGTDDLATLRANSNSVTGYAGKLPQQNPPVGSLEPQHSASMITVNDDGGGENDDDVTVNNANNPLQLLAIASSIPEPESNDPYAEANNDLSPSMATATATTDDDETRDFFSPMTSKLDVGEDLDPLDLGLVADEEVEVLFS